MSGAFVYEEVTSRYRLGRATLPDGETTVHVSIAGPIPGKGYCVRLWAENPYVDDSLDPSVYLGEFDSLDSARSACDTALAKVSGIRRPRAAYRQEAHFRVATAQTIMQAIDTGRRDGTVWHNV